jgi:integrase
VPQIASPAFMRPAAMVSSRAHAYLLGVGVGVLLALKRLLGDAQERGEVAQNVVRSLSKRRKRKESKRRQKLQVGVDIPTPAEIKAIVEHLRGRWRPLLLTAIFTGLRASELRGLRWADVDLKRGEVHVRQRADRYQAIGKPKSSAGERTVPMPPLLVNTLREWKLACPKSDLGLVFPTGTGAIDYHANIITRGLAPVQVAAGVVKGKKAKYTGLHALRHFYASWCINRREDGGLGLPLKVVQHRMGHSSIQMTADIYGHLFPSGDDGAELEAAQRALLG